MRSSPHYVGTHAGAEACQGRLLGEIKIAEDRQKFQAKRLPCNCTSCSSCHAPDIESLLALQQVTLAQRHERGGFWAGWEMKRTARRLSTSLIAPTSGAPSLSAVAGKHLCHTLC